MDNNICKINSVARFMLSYLDRINDTVNLHSVPKTQMKADNSPVTALDFALSSLVEEIHRNHFKDSFFYSEENFGRWDFPLLALDPVDGTREYIEGRPEWALSVGLFKSREFVGEGWVYNPMTRESFCGEKSLGFAEKVLYKGEVSRSEWKRGLFTHHKDQKFQLSPMGSIAYKLGRLSAGKIDFVVSLQPKNIWDIAGGTLLCQEAGLKFYSQGKAVTKVEQMYRPPLIWCPEELSVELLRLFP